MTETLKYQKSSSLDSLPGRKKWWGGKKPKQMNTPPFTTLENKQDFQGSAEEENKGLLRLYCSGVEFKFKRFVYKKL